MRNEQIIELLKRVLTKRIDQFDIVDPSTDSMCFDLTHAISLLLPPVPANKLNTEENRRKLADAVWETLTLNDIYEQFIHDKCEHYKQSPDDFDEDAEWFDELGLVGHFKAKGGE